jgi:hypothetical protein
VAGATCDALFRRQQNEPQPSGSAVWFTPLTEVEKAVNAAISGIDFDGAARRRRRGAKLLTSDEYANL